LNSQVSREAGSGRPWASVIIPVWNGRSYLPDCLDALLRQEPAGFEVIAVDNASADGSGDLIAALCAGEHYAGVRLIRNRENRGFAGACNAGLRAATGEVLVLLNQDTRVYEGWLKALVEACRAPEIGVVGAKALYPDEKTVQHAGGSVEWPLGLAAHYGYGQPDSPEWSLSRQVDFVTGAAMAVRRDVLDQVGLLDEGFWPGYYEDVDFCFRVREAGYEVWYAPEARLIHAESTALGGTRALYVASHRGRLRFVLKHLPPDRFLAEFVPAEGQRFLPAAQEEAADALRYLYLEMIPVAARILARRWGDEGGAGVPAEQAWLADSVLDALLRLYQEASPRAVPVEPVLDELDFVSPVPLIGPLIAGLRSLWYGVAARWAVRYVTRQQSAINQEVLRRFAEQAAINAHTERSLVGLWQEVTRLLRQLESERSGRE
jgi:GT2 family glycosyltransferase